MSTVNNSTQTTSNNAALIEQLQRNNNASGSTDGGTTNSASQTQDRFLQLLVAQMKNQDPLNPMDNAAVTSQMAQISTVEGIEKLNTTMGKFTAAGTTAAGSTGLIGQNVLTPGTSLTMSSDKSTRAGVTLDQPASQLAVELFNADGKVVDKKLFTDLDAGTVGFEWTGKNADGGTYGAGNYTMRATVMSDANATATTLVTDTVVGVTQASSGVMAQLASGSQMNASDIKGVFRP